MLGEIIDQTPKQIYITAVSTTSILMYSLHLHVVASTSILNILKMWLPVLKGIYTNLKITVCWH